MNEGTRNLILQIMCLIVALVDCAIVWRPVIKKMIEKRKTNKEKKQ